MGNGHEGQLDRKIRGNRGEKDKVKKIKSLFHQGSIQPKPVINQPAGHMKPSGSHPGRARAKLHQIDCNVG